MCRHVASSFFLPGSRKCHVCDIEMTNRRVICVITSSLLPSRSSGTSSSGILSLATHLGAHLGVVLLEALAQAGGHGHGLLHAAGDAACLAVGEGFGGEVIDARHEAVVDQVSEQLSPSFVSSRGERERECVCVCGWRERDLCFFWFFLFCFFCLCCFCLFVFV